jgi:hypothetical protein
MSVNYEVLDNVLEVMGAKKDTRPLQLDPENSREQIKFELKQGVQVEAANFDQITTIAGLFSHKGEHAFLYIDEPHNSEQQLQENPAVNAQRFHLVKHCSTLLTMHHNNKSDRYVLIQNSNGEFPSKPEDPITRITDTSKSIPARLRPCKNCLAELSYKGYLPDRTRLSPSQRTNNHNIFYHFDVAKFFQHYEPFFFDTKYYRDNPGDGKANYTKDHATIREKLLIEKDFKCDDCGVQLKSRPELLHLHHINGRRGDNSLKNLKILCVACHSLQHNHQHMKKLVSREVTYIRQQLAKQQKQKLDQ